MKARIEAVLFDAAGTLINLREPVGVTYARLALEFGVVCSPRRVDQAFRRVFRSMPAMVFPGQSPASTLALEREWWRELVSRVFQDVTETPRFRSFSDYFDSLFRHFAQVSAWRAADGAQTTLAALRSRGLRTGMVSNFDHRLRGLLEGLGLAPLLEVVVQPLHAGAAKPDPRIFTLALRRLQVPPSLAIYVGDNAREDIAGAKAAGLGAVDVTRLSSLTALLQHPRL